MGTPPGIAVIQIMDIDATEPNIVAAKLDPSPNFPEEELLKQQKMMTTCKDLISIPSTSTPLEGTTMLNQSQSLNPLQQDSFKWRITTVTHKDSISIPLPLTPRKTRMSKCPSVKLALPQTFADQDEKMGPVGISWSAIASQALKAKMRAGTLKINGVWQKKFEDKCRTSDPQAEFRYSDNWQVFNLRCGKWFMMTKAYNSTIFWQHIKGCKKMGSKSKFTTLNSYFVKGLTDAIEVMKATVPLRMATDYSCLGITSDHD